MKMLSLLAIALTLGLTLPMADAEAAKRLGGGKSTGMQRQMNTPDKAPTAAPAQSATAAAPAAGAAAAPARSSWMGPLAGLAAGIGLAALASHFGFGEELATMMMIGLLVMAVLMVIGFVMRKRMGAQGPAAAGAAASPLQYSATPQGAPAPRPYNLSMPGSSVEPAATAPVAPAAARARNIPADFDVQGFVRNAKVNFIRLQAANDAGNLDDIREFTTPEMFAEIKMSIEERGGAKQHTDVVSINADVLEVAEEANRYVVSVRFTGTVREDDANAESVDEIWHLTKPRDGASGWMLAGIQQAQ